MATSQRKTSSIGIYHVIYRGINKQCIFEEEEDYAVFMNILRKYQSECGYSLYAYCLMSNHMHLVIKPGSMPLGQVFQHVVPSFVNWYNIKYQRVGHLFQNRFMSVPIKNEVQLLTVIRYVHQNPVKAGLCDFPEEYKYSSFRDYFGNVLIDKQLMLSLVSEEYFRNLNREKNNDKCMDIDEETPRVLPDSKACKIMQDVSGCSCVADFQALPADRRDEALRDMYRVGISMKQANRITGISYGVIKKVVKG